MKDNGFPEEPLTAAQSRPEFAFGEVVTAAPGPEIEPTPPEPPGKRHRGRRLVIWVLVLALLVWALGGTRPGRRTEGAGLRRPGCCTLLLAGTDQGGSRTDTILLLSLSRYGRDIRLMSLPRDTYVTAGYSVPKINSACAAAGGGAEGMEELMARVSEVVGFMPDGYVLVDLTAFIDLVDLMGGVEFEVPVDMYYVDPTQNLNINLCAGMQHLDGEQAMQVVRFRSGYAMADLTRVTVQRDFIRAALRQWLRPENVTKLPGLLSLARQEIVTDLKLHELLWVGWTVLFSDLGDMQTDTLPGAATMIGDGSYYVADEAAVAALMEAYSPYGF